MGSPVAGGVKRFRILLPTRLGSQHTDSRFVTEHITDLQRERLGDAEASGLRAPGSLLQALGLPLVFLRGVLQEEQMQD